MLTHTQNFNYEYEIFYLQNRAVKSVFSDSSYEDLEQI